MKINNEKLKGGLADNKSYQYIADKHKVSLDHIKSQVKIGIEVEKEHSSDISEIIEIVKDHLMESANYYTHLKEMEKDFEKGHKYIRRESDGKGGWNYIYKEQSTKNERTEEIEIKRLSPEEEQGRIRGGRANVEATKILRGYEISDSAEPEQIDVLISKQEEILTKYAKENGKWIDYNKISDKESFGGGEEAKVFMNEDKVSVTKVYDYKLFSISPLEFIDNRISLHNYLFPDAAYELIGFTNRPDRGFSFIVKQPFIDGENTPVSEISKELSRMGFKDIGGNTYMNDDYIIDDLHKRNVFTKDGKLFFIDTVISLNEEGEGYGGKRKYNNDIQKAINAILSANISKAWKKQPIGTITTHKDGKKYKKVSETGNVKVDWKLVTSDKTSKPQENGSKKEKIAGDNSTKLSKDQLVEHAKNASEQALQSTIKNSPNEEERKAAHKELDRRKKEEVVQEEDAKNKLSSLPKGDIFEDAKSISSVFKKSNRTWSEVIEMFEKNRSNGKITEIPIDEINITQPNIQSNKAIKMMEDIDKTPIIDVVEFKDGEKAIFDGHHRLMSQWALGKERIKVNLVKESDEKKDETQNEFVEKFRTLSDEQVKFYLEAPHEKVKEAARIIVDERGLNIVSKKDYIKQFKDYSDLYDEAYDVYLDEHKKIVKYLDDNYEIDNSLKFYTGSGFKDIREFITTGKTRNQELRDLKKDIDNLSKFIEDNKIDKDIVLHRMVMDSRSNPFFSNLKEGDIYEDKSFSSTSMIKMTKFGDFNIKILAKKGSNVANAYNRGELEYLIDKGSKFRVIEKHENGLGITVELL